MSLISLWSCEVIFSSWSSTILKITWKQVHIGPISKIVTLPENDTQLSVYIVDL